MKKIKYITFYILVLILLNSCSSFSEVGKVMRNEKITNSDEFLVKKRDPLTLPPDFKTLPRPGGLRNSEKKAEKDSIKKIIQIQNAGQSKTNSSSSIEQSIINKIGK
tara:strand:- start:89 stop:409 length:321 start_codon:yes stop_codon:yes gene_type:complete